MKDLDFISSILNICILVGISLYVFGAMMTFKIVLVIFAVSLSVQFLVNTYGTVRYA